jgi:hypothetical protein
MDRDDIIRMARSAIRLAAKDTDLTNFDQEATILDRYEFLYWFAKEAAAAERERIIAKNAPEIEKINAHIKALEEAVAAEREACAKLAEETVCDTHLPTGVKIYGSRVAAAIRARGQS